MYTKGKFSLCTDNIEIILMNNYFCCVFTNGISYLMYLLLILGHKYFSTQCIFNMILFFMIFLKISC